MAQNSNVPRSHEDYITQVSEEIEGRVTKKLSQEFSRTKNRLLGALWRLDNFLLNPLNGSYSGTVLETSGTHLAQTRERKRTTPRVTLILKQASSTNRRRETLAQKMAKTEWQEFTRKSHTAPPVNCQKSRKWTTLPVNRKSAVRIPLRRSEQTKFFWPFISWQTTTFLQTFIITSTEFPNSQNRSPHRCQRLTGNLRSLSCLKIFSKRASKLTISWLKITESITSILSWGETAYRLSKTLTAKPERIWEKFWPFSAAST